MPPRPHYSKPRKDTPLRLPRPTIIYCTTRARRGLLSASVYITRKSAPAIQRRRRQQDARELIVAARWPPAFKQC